MDCLTRLEQLKKDVTFRNSDFIFFIGTAAECGFEPRRENVFVSPDEGGPAKNI
jgi:hypothetical protein